MEIFQKENSKIYCIAIKGSVSATLTPEDERSIGELLEEDITLLLFDLSSLVYLGSTVLRVILNAVKKIRSKQGKVVLCSPNQYVREIFEISGFGPIIPIAESVESGVNYQPG